ncbi:hypothetical protein A1D17_21215 [Pseudomonas fluorescens]|uniref:Uncharacterized protein n=1 Tax=Pseudomonas fluorescens TaxID=294 RepID=A0A161Z9V1_PSEFL|nr:hypothetical protein A1D17_21215 [Pseudomonas fluorescens]
MQVALIFIRHPITILAITTHLTTTAARVFTGAIVTIISVVPAITIAVDTIAGTADQLIGYHGASGFPDAPFFLWER